MNQTPPPLETQPKPKPKPTTTTDVVVVPKDNQESGEDLLTSATTKSEQGKDAPSPNFVRPPQKQATPTFVATVLWRGHQPHPEDMYVIHDPPPALPRDEDEEEEEEDYPVLYARACGALDAWLILLQGTDHPYIVVPEDSPATDFLVRLLMIRDTPPYARSDPRGLKTVRSVSIELESNPDSWQLIRKNILAARQIRFALLNYDAYQYSSSGSDDDDDYYHDRHGNLSEAFRDASSQERHWAMEALMSSPMISPPDLNSQLMIEAMGDESVWMVPMLQAEMLGRECLQEEADRHAGNFLLPLTRSPISSGAEEEEEEESYRPRFSAGLRIATTIETPDKAPMNALDALVGHSSSATEDVYTPVQSHEESRQQLHHEMAQVWNSIVTAIGWRQTPQESFADAVSLEEGTEPNVEVSLPSADEASSSHSDLDTVIKLQESPTTTKKEPASPPSPPPQRKVHAIEEALMDTSWCRLSISEFMAWRCEAQSPLVDSLLSRNLAHTENKENDWVLQALGGSTMRKLDLCAAVRKRAPALVALGDAQERLFAAVKDVCARGKRTDNRQVILDLEIWEALKAAAGVSWEAHQRCFDRPLIEATVHWAGGTNVTGGITNLTTIHKGKEKEKETAAGHHE